MKITIRQGSIAQAAAEIIILGIHEGERSFVREVRAIDAAGSGMIQDVVHSGDFKGELYRSLLLYNRSRKIAARRILLVGLGRRKDFTADKMRNAAAQAARVVRDLGLRELLMSSAFAQMPGLSHAGSIRALVEGMMLGLYTFEEFKTSSEGKKKNAVEAITLLAENARELAEARVEARKAEITRARGTCCPRSGSTPGKQRHAGIYGANCKSNRKKERPRLHRAQPGPGEKTRHGMLFGRGAGQQRAGAVYRAGTPAAERAPGRYYCACRQGHHL